VHKGQLPAWKKKAGRLHRVVGGRGPLREEGKASKSFDERRMLKGDTKRNERALAKGEPAREGMEKNADPGGED